MDERFKIFLDRLRPGETEHIEETFSPEALEISDREAEFHAPIRVVGAAALTDKTLVLKLAVSTTVTLSCAICMDPVEVLLEAKEVVHTEDLTKNTSAIFDFSQVIREALFLELPYKVECHGGECPERATLAKYFSKGENSDGSPT